MGDQGKGRVRRQRTALVLAALAVVVFLAALASDGWAGIGVAASLVLLFAAGWELIGPRSRP